MSENDKGPIINVTMPFGYSDFVKAVRDFLALAGDVRNAVTTTSEVYQRSRTKKAARNLGTLSFPPNETRGYLVRISEGRGTEADFAEIKARLKKSAEASARSMEHLEKYRDYIREKYGMAAAHTLSELLKGDGGKADLRFQLELFADIGSEEFYNQEMIADEAKHLLGAIDRLNDRLIKMHDMILGLGEK